MILFSHTTVFGTAVLAFVSALLFSAILLARRAQRVAQATGVDAFLRRLVAVDRHKLASAAHTLPEGEGSPDDTWERDRIWELVGGMDGVAALRHNCDVLIDMVYHLQQWYPEALPIAEQLRLQAREVQWHLDRLRGAELRGHLQAAFPDYAQRAAIIYCAMTERVLALCETTELAGLQDLRAVL